MAAATKDDVTFSKSLKRVQIPAAFTEVTIQTLVDAIRQYEDDLAQLDIPRIISAAGKDPLGGGEFTVITLTLENSWQLHFQGAVGAVYRVTAGNLIATDTAGVPSEPVFTDASTKTVVLANATTGSINETTVQNKLDYADGVWLDADNGTAGTLHPVGTLASPVNNFANAITIAAANSAQKIKVLPSVAAVPCAVDVSDLVIEGTTPTVKIVLNAGNNVTGTGFVLCELSGAAFGTSWFGDTVHFNTITGMNGSFHGCLFMATATLSGNASFLDCSSAVIGLGTAVFDGGSVASLSVQFRGWTGGLSLNNFVATTVMSIDMMPGRLVIGNTVTGGTYKVRGIGEPIENAGVGITLDSDGFVSADDIQVARKILTNRTETNKTTGKITVYEVDDVTVAFTADVFEDAAGLIAYDGGGIERRNRLI